MPMWIEQLGRVLDGQVQWLDGVQSGRLFARFVGLRASAVGIW